MPLTPIEDFEKSNERSDKTLHHGYQRFYPYFLEPLRKLKDLKMLELGYDDGHSIAIWQNYFQNPRIDAIDLMEDPRDSRLHRYFRVDQDDTVQLEAFAQNVSSKYHFIIDDASHVPTHQWETFIRFFDLLEPSGVYIIEDTETNFWGRAWQYGYGFNSDQFSLYQHLDIINEYINSEFLADDLQQKHGLTDLENRTLSQIELMTVGQNCLIFVKKNELFNTFYRHFDDYQHKKSVNRNVVQNYSLLKRAMRKIKRKS